jgi:hypothetical protein
MTRSSVVPVVATLFVIIAQAAFAGTETADYSQFDGLLSRLPRYPPNVSALAQSVRNVTDSELGRARLIYDWITKNGATAATAP